MDDSRTLLETSRQEIDSLNPPLTLGRRGFFKASLGAGFAAAVLPVAAQTMITTDTQGLDAGEAKVPAGDGAMPAYLAQPAGKTGLATVLVVQEVFGVHEHIKDVCRRLAKQGFLAVAPELYARQGDPAKYTDTGALVEGSRAEGVRRAGDGRPRRGRGLGGEERRQCGQARHHGLLLGRPRDVDVRRAQSRAQRQAVAWYGATARAYYPGDKAVIEVAIEHQGADARPVRRRGRRDTATTQSSEMQAALKAAGNTRSRVHHLSRHAARVLRRLSVELSQGGGRGRLEAADGLVQDSILAERRARVREHEGLDSPRYTLCSKRRGATLTVRASLLPAAPWQTLSYIVLANVVSTLVSIATGGVPELPLLVGSGRQVGLRFPPDCCCGGVHAPAARVVRERRQARPRSAGSCSPASSASSCWRNWR